MRMCVNAHVCAFVSTCVRVHVRAHMCAFVSLCVSMCVCVCVHAAVRARSSLQLLECEAEGSLLQQGARGRAAALDAGGATLDALEEHARTLRVDAAEERRCLALETGRAAQARVVEAEFAALWTEVRCGGPVCVCVCVCADVYVCV